MDNKKRVEQIIQREGFEIVSTEETWKNAVLGVDSFTRTSLIFHSTWGERRVMQKINKSRKAFGIR